MEYGLGWSNDQYGIKWTTSGGIHRAAAGGMIATAGRRGWIITRDTADGREVVARSGRDYTTSVMSRTACQRALWSELGMQ